MITGNIENDIIEATEKGNLMPSSCENIKIWLESGFLPEWAVGSIRELVEKEAWGELNDRFYQNLSFGTGGMRSRTIGKKITSVEQGIGSEAVGPEYAAVG